MDRGREGNSKSNESRHVGKVPIKLWKDEVGIMYLESNEPRLMGVGGSCERYVV